MFEICQITTFTITINFCTRSFIIEVKLKAEINRIHVDPEIYHGKPCIRGTRIPVSLVLEMLEYGSSIS
ncbi:MAG TPA: DUF433 domain-containing protein [Candidatus Lokiarchaeia archaeon]|nr:DUF433 domain-containing protein [Candidatus Lokiarchaeia archaeon]